MLCSTLLLGLATTAAAIEAAFYISTCNVGASFVCTNMAPDRCCSISSSPFNAIVYRSIPAGQRTIAQGFTGGVCNNFPAAQVSGTGPAEICIPAGTATYTATRFLIATATKRNRGSLLEREETCDVGGCVAQRPDALVFADGVTTVDISGLEDGAFEELYEFAKNGGIAADLPQKFLQNLSIAT